MAWRHSGRRGRLDAAPRRAHPGSRGAVSALYEHGFIQFFDWPAWQPTAEQYLEEPQRLAGADLGTLQKLLTIHVRKDRFCEGHFTEMTACGHITAILERLAELSSDA